MNYIPVKSQVEFQRATTGLFQSGLLLLLATCLVGAPTVAVAQDNHATIGQVPHGRHTITTVHHAPVGDKVGSGARAMDAPPGNVLVNGDFAAGLDGWSPVILGGVEGPGSISADSGQALLLEGGSFLVSLRQAFTAPDDALEMSFDVIIAPGFDRSVTGMPDAFEVHLLDDANQSVVPTWDPLATSFFNLQEDLTQNVAPGVTVEPVGGGEPQAFHVVVDLSGVSGFEFIAQSLSPALSLEGSGGSRDGLSGHVTLYVNLIGADSDTAGGLRVDNFLLARRSDPPTCNAGGPYVAECQGDITSVPLDGRGSTDPGEAELSYLWTVDCPAANFNDPTSPTPILRTASPNCNVTLHLDNGFGGVSTCTTAVTVVDTTPPTITCPGLHILETSDPNGVPVGNLPILAAAVDLCDNAATITSNAPTTGFFPVGDTTLTFSATDDTGNRSTCTTTVRVTLSGGPDPCANDTTPPEITCPGIYVLETSNAAGVPVGNLPILAAAVDLCDNAVTITSNAPTTGFFPVGDTTVTFSAQDASGNRRTCTTTVRVTLSGGPDPCANDTTPPEITCPGNYVLETSNAAGVPVGNLPILAAAVDLCDNAVTITSNAPTTGFFPIGKTWVTFTARGASGNTASCTTTVEVVEVEGAPGTPDTPGQQPAPDTRVFVDERVITTRPVFRLCGLIGPFPLWAVVGLMFAMGYRARRAVRRRRPR